jgi:hypothetical protein
MDNFNEFNNVIANRNFLSTLGFKFTITRAPKVAYFSNNANIPDLTLGVVNQPNYLNDIPVPGDKIEFADFTLKFLVDENLENYMEIQNWMRGLGFPESLQEIYDLQKTKSKYENPPKSQMNIYSDGTLIVYNSNQNYNFEVRFKSLFPYKLSSLQFDSTVPDNQYFSADVSFKYMMYNIVDKNGKTL